MCFLRACSVIVFPWFLRLVLSKWTSSINSEEVATFSNEIEHRKDMNSFSEAQRLYHSRFQHDGCGVGFNSDISGSESSKILQIGLKAVMSLAHTRAVRCCVRGGDNDYVWSGFLHSMRPRACVWGGNILGRRQQSGLGVVFRGICGSHSLLRIPASKSSKASKIQNAGRSPMKSSTGNGK